jgi:hypothetical protein
MTDRIALAEELEAWSRNLANHPWSPWGPQTRIKLEKAARALRSPPVIEGAGPIKQMKLGYISRHHEGYDSEPDDEALIFLNDDNEQTCHVQGPNAKAMAQQIINAVCAPPAIEGAGRVLILDAETHRDLDGILTWVINRCATSSDNSADIIGNGIDDIFKLGSTFAPPPCSGPGGREKIPQDENRQLRDHPQWEIIAGALQRYNTGEREADYTLGLVDYGFRLLNESRPATAPQGQETTDAMTAEEIYALCKSTLIGFSDELTEHNIKFICDQISRKVMFAFPLQDRGQP